MKYMITNEIFLKNKNAICRVLLIFLLFSSCKKDDLLNEKPNSQLVIPSTIQDFQALLDVYPDMNSTPSLGEISADNYYLLPSDYNGASVTNVERNAYLWNKEIFDANLSDNSWNYSYLQVLNANVTLEGVDKIAATSTNQKDINTLKGEAYFYRAYAFYNIAQVFAPAYDSATAATDLGIPLRLSSDVSKVSVRSTLKQTYDQIFNDLDKANNLLPEALPINNLNRPCKIAVKALLARIYLSMGAYSKAGAAADSALHLYNTLVDYNTLSQTANFPFSRTNPEVIYQSMLESGSKVIAGLIGAAYVDSNLYNSYSSNDLRKNIFFKLTNGLPKFKPGYNGSIFSFSGLAVDELYLIRAECFARAGNYIDAMNDLNTLLKKRFSGNYTLITAANAVDALAKVLLERKKELLVRGTRWLDLRRLNKEGYNIMLQRKLDNQTYTLPPGSPRYVLPIPADVIALTGMQQNPR